MKTKDNDFYWKAFWQKCFDYQAFFKLSFLFSLSRIHWDHVNKNTVRKINSKKHSFFLQHIFWWFANYFQTISKEKVSVLEIFLDWKVDKKLKYVLKKRLLPKNLKSVQTSMLWLCIKFFIPNYSNCLRNFPSTVIIGIEVDLVLS